MNLLKLFNFKYFMQNIKKSKMAIILFLLVVPIFTALTIITVAKESILEFYEIGLANIIFMYITPFVLSVSLFGYVYQKKSIDFMGSMPISRKSIFITNTIGGIILILLAQFITFIVSALIGSLTNSMVFIGMLWDIFLYESMAYIFVFTISNLAMSISGNVRTQIVVTLLITFIIPVSIAYFDAFGGRRSYLVADEYEISSIIESRNYTAPSAIFSCMLNGMDYEYNGASIAKMFVLSIVYIIIGYIMFNRKEMEYAGTSFENKYLHFIVKGLTLVPFIMILVPIVEENEWEAALFILVIIAVYFLIYDLVTNRKNKLIVNFGAMLISIAVLFGVYDILANVADETRIKVNVDNIKTIVVEDIGYKAKGINAKISNKDVIQEIIYSSQKANLKSTTKVNATLILSNGATKRSGIVVDTDVLELILNNIEAKDFEIKSVECNSLKELDKESKENLKIALNNALTIEGLKQICDTNRSTSKGIYVYEYRNHGIRKVNYPINLSKDVFNIITKIENKNAVDAIEKHKYFDIEISIDEKAYYGEPSEKLISFMKKNVNKSCNIDEKYICIIFSGYKFYTNVTEELAEIINDLIEQMPIEYNKCYDPIVNEGTTTIQLDENSFSI